MIMTNKASYLVNSLLSLERLEEALGLLPGRVHFGEPANLVVGHGVPQLLHLSLLVALREHTYITSAEGGGAKSI